MSAARDGGRPGPADASGLVRRLGLLEDRLRAVEDLAAKESLRELLVRGWRALDARDWDAWIACWAEDAVLEFGPWEAVRGRKEVLRTVRDAEEAYAHMQHHLLNTAFEVAGDRATGIGYMWFVAVGGEADPGGPFQMGGPYDWDFVRTDAGWLVARQRLGVWWRAGEDPVGGLS
ncbi:nuclear transport factor 2 family protein [Nocardiopsis sp. NPDC101807]|uniref:nuclear transport factor 2 family protein n=1 Tax=Nocardiopsis sp. NPDC101807 TaxID=3364339 RepID=UPI003822122D